MDYKREVELSTEYILEKIKDFQKVEVGLILGSGLGVLADEIENPVIIPYENIPNFPVSTVEGHKGQFVIGTLSDKIVMAMQGRFHFYEGYSMKEVTFPIRVFQALGIKKVILTNAAGGVNLEFKSGDLMIIEDHINFSFDNPLIGKNFSSMGPRFPDTSTVYKNYLIKIAEKSAKELNLDIKKGVYLFNTGPTYETPAEIKMARTLGADAVGMSTVPESIAAAHGGIDVLGISLITNMAAGILNQPLSHEEVVETANRVKLNFIKLVKKILFKLEVK
ncbi:MAG: purine-nucleoside phosphorylase [Clostridiales bacterium]|nr:purine-nucleoside phosphorylase [Clostridiales bacterium]